MDLNKARADMEMLRAEIGEARSEVSNAEQILRSLISKADDLSREMEVHEAIIRTAESMNISVGAEGVSINSYLEGPWPRHFKKTWDQFLHLDDPDHGWTRDWAMSVVVAMRAATDRLEAFARTLLNDDEVEDE